MPSRCWLRFSLAVALVALFAAPCMADAEDSFKAPELSLANFDSTLKSVRPRHSRKRSPFRCCRVDQFNASALAARVSVRRAT